MCLLWACCVLPWSRFHFLRERISCYFRSTVKNIFEKRCRKFLSISSSAGKYWNKASFSCKKCADAPIIRREKWQTHKVDRTNNSFIQLRVFFSRIHKKSANQHYVGIPIYDNLYGGCWETRLSHTEDMRQPNSAIQRIVDVLLNWGRHSSSRAKEAYQSRTSVRVITPFPVKFRLIIAALCRIIYIIM